eukprot:4200921-Pleurochrysis_carterae.AAC.1
MTAATVTAAGTGQTDNERSKSTHIDKQNTAAHTGACRCACRQAHAQGRAHACMHARMYAWARILALAFTPMLHTCRFRRHLVHEVTSPQAFEGLSVAGRPVRRPGTRCA